MFGNPDVLVDCLDEVLLRFTVGGGENKDLSYSISCFWKSWSAISDSG